MNMVAYRGCKLKIENGIYETQEEMQTMLDVFYMNGRITQDQYEELTTMLNSKHVEE